MVSKSHGGFGFRHLKLVWKLVAVLALVVGPLMGAILYSSVLSRKIEHEIADVRDLHSPVIIAAMTLQSELQASLIHFRDYLLTGESKHEALRAADWARIEAEAKRYDLLSQGFTVTANIARWKALRERLAETKKVQDAIASRHSPGSIGSAETVAALYNLAAPASSAALAIIRGKPDGKGGFEGGLIVSQQELLHTEISDAFELTHHSNIIALWLLAAAIGVAFLGVLILLRGVSRPLSRITEAMNAVAGHNYEVTIPAQDQRDEVGDMARALSVFRDGLEANERLEVEAKARLTIETERQAKIGAAVASFEKAAEAVVLTVSSAATELEAAASDLTAAASKATAEASSVAAAAEEATANVNGVAAAGEELAATASEIARLLQSTRDSADASAGQMRAADGNVQELALAARKIGEIVHLIDGLAGQTNLLALNATIEAARAGEAGRGFAVVASEVKELANQTARATSEISDMVQRIQGVTESTVSAIQDVDQGIQTISGSTAEISGAVSQQESATREIARNVHETAKGVEEVNRSIAFVSSAANSTAAASSQVFAAAGELAQQAETMRKEVQCFLDAVRAA